MMTETLLPLRESLRQLVRQLGILEKNEAECCELNLTQCHALVEIGRTESMSLNDLADLLLLDKSTLSRSVNQMVEYGLVERVASTTDRRFVTLNLTEKGRLLYQDTEETMQRYYKRILETLPSEKHEQIIESLSLLNKAFSDSKCCL